MFESLYSTMMNPAMAIGAGAVASPILIHILSKRRYRRIRWGAMAFLLEAQHRNRRRVRLEQLILLLLRCLIVFLIALLMTRPFIRQGRLTSILGVSPRTERIILLDDSYSMDVRPRSGMVRAGASSFARAIQATNKLAHWIAEDSPNDSLSVILTSHPREPLLALPSLSDINLERLRESLSRLRPSQTTAEVAKGMSAVADMIQSQSTQANAAVYVISDFQRNDWVSPAAGNPNNPHSVITPLAELSQKDHSIKLVLVSVGEPGADNIAITKLVSRQPQIVAGVPAKMEVTVSNLSSRTLQQADLSVAVARHRLPPVTIPKLPAGQQTRVPLEITFPEQGSDYVQVSLAGAALRRDALRLDNNRALAVDVISTVRVLIVDGEPNNDRYRDEVYLLKTSLRPAGRAASGNELTVIDEQELEDTDLGGFHVVILANVSRLGPTAGRNIEGFVRGGGGLIIFAGDQVDIEHYNSELFRGGEGVLPMSLKNVVEPPPSIRAVSFGWYNIGHPIFRSFVDQLADVLQRVRIDAFLSVEEPPEKDSVTGANNQPEPARAPAEILARFNDAQETPAVVQRLYGKGVCLFIATSVDQEWNNWASNFSFLPMMLELVQYAAKPIPSLGQVEVNDPIVCSVDGGLFSPMIRLRPPGYPAEPEVALSVESTGEMAGRVRYEKTNKVGMYQLLLQTTSGELKTRYAAVNPNPAESDLRPASKVELTDALSEMPFEYLGDLNILADSSEKARLELWWPLLLTVIVLLMSEHVLAWWFGTRGSPAPAVA